MADSTFEKEFLEAHNAYRQKHGASPLIISKDLCRSAQKWAEYLLSRKTMQHSQGDYGENLYYAWSSNAKQLKGKEAVDSWYNEIKDYNFRRPGFQSSTGHFTQVVWKGSEKLGLGLATDGNTVFVVGQYYPAGNISNPGYFEKNVLPSGSSVEKRNDADAKSGGNDRHSSPSKQTESDHSSSSSTESTFEKEFLEAHNAYRQKHGASPLTISKDLCRSAQKWAEYLLSRKTMQHSQGDYGENLYYAWSSDSKQLKGKEAVDNWYNEIKDYSFRRPGFQSKTGHFTQVVWKGSKKLGLGLATDGKTVFVVGQYYPAGNVTNSGYFEKNVLPAGSVVETDAHDDDDDAAKSGKKDQDKVPSQETGSNHNTSNKSTGSTFEKEFLEAHNAYRQKHGASPLTISKDLCRSAQKWAEYLLSRKTMQHSMADYGENLYYTWSSVPKQIKGKEPVDSWYNEIKDYNFSRPGFQSTTGHFTQVVWKGSEKLGVGLATDGNTIFVVGQYLPAGNVSNPGYFEKNVLPAGSAVETSAAGSGGKGGRSEDNSTSAAGTGSGKSSDFTQSAVDAMNGYRRKHGAKPLSLSPSLCKEAQEWADHLVRSNLVQNQSKGHGESLWYQTGPASAIPKGEDVVKSWYDENSKYNFSHPGYQNGTGNFTQIVWRSSEEVGMALATNGSGLFISVAFYEPAGNINSRSHFQDNVKAKS